MSNVKIEHGDFQTPFGLAFEVCQLVLEKGIHPETIVEPTCGAGSFLEAAISTWPMVSEVYGYDINHEYVQSARKRISELSSSLDVTIEESDFFQFDWHHLAESIARPALFIGNPPWVTNSVLGSLSSKNLPSKTNFQRHRGYDAITGKSNFDIAEWMLICLSEALSQAGDGHIAMLCKTATARKVLLHGWKSDHSIVDAEMFHIDAKKHFGVAADACLLLMRYSAASQRRICGIYPNLWEEAPAKEMGLVGEHLVADVNKYEATKDLYGSSYFRWRSGLKHDAAKVMELEKADGAYVNGLGERVHIEDAYVYPLLKSSDLGNGRLIPRKHVLVTQQQIGDETEPIRENAPQTWSYLERHRHLLDARRSAIYRGKPSFCIFGIGPYSFSEWKVAISGLYKRTHFYAIGPVDGKPVMLDDTCYLAPCRSEVQANWVAHIINAKPAQDLLDSLVFLDSKRPVNVEILNRIDLKKVAERIGEADVADRLLADAELADRLQHDFVFER